MDNLILVYRDASVLKEIRKEVDKVSSMIVNTEKLERRIYSQLASYFGECENRSFTRIRQIIAREIKLAKNQFRTQHTILFSDLAVTTGFGESEEQEYEPKDVLANVSETVVSKISLKEIKKELGSLATTERDQIILNELSKGHGETSIARTLASLLGGKESSHRRQVTRFRMKCQDKLGLVPAIKLEKIS